ncbi:MAG: hypothetical protein JST11_06100 [Acidobacteria bacterium]|nr:hypothetical protein [Acidobacteriota bacterium]
MNQLAIVALSLAACGMLVAGPPAAAAKAARTPAKAAAMRAAWPPETLSGRIDQIVPGSHEIVVKDTSGVPFDFVVPHGTRIMNGDQAVTLKDLQRDRNQSVSVRFVPESRGDVALSIRIGG